MSLFWNPYKHGKFERAPSFFAPDSLESVRLDPDPGMHDNVRIVMADGTPVCGRVVPGARVTLTYVLDDHYELR